MKESEDWTNIVFEKAYKNRMIFAVALGIISVCFLVMYVSLPNNAFDKIIAFGSKLRGKELEPVIWRRILQSGFVDTAIAAFMGAICLLLHGRVHFSKRQENITCWIVFIVFAVLTLATVILHEPWRDEIHAWFLAKEYSIPRLWYEMRYEGHFVLWYLILMPFAKLGFPLITLNIISWAVFCIAVALFLQKSSFSLASKITVLCSCAFLFWYPVVSRCYVLIPVLLFLLAILYEDRNSKPLRFAFLIALLANTHAYIEGFVAGISLVFFIKDVLLVWNRYTKEERIAHIAALAIIAFGVVIAFLQVAPALFVNDRSGAASIHFNILSVAGFLTGSYIWIPLTPIFSAIFVFVLTYLFQKDRTQFFILACSLLYMGIFAIVLYGAGVANRALLWFFLLIFALWNLKGASARKSALLIACTLFIVRPSLNVQDWRKDFSPMQSAVKYIETNYAEKTPIFIQTGHHTATFAKMLPKEFPAYHVETMNPVKLYSFSRKYNQYEEKPLSDYVQNIGNSSEFSFPIILFSAVRFSLDEVFPYRFSEKEFPCMYGGNLWLYEVQDLEQQEPRYAD